MKTGKTEAAVKAVKTHTGSIAGSDEIFNASLKKFEGVRVEDIDELLCVSKALALQRTAKGERTVIVTNSGGPGVILTEFIEAYGLKIPEP